MSPNADPRIGPSRSLPVRERRSTGGHQPGVKRREHRRSGSDIWMQMVGPRSSILRRQQSDLGLQVSTQLPADQQDASLSPMLHADISRVRAASHLESPAGLQLGSPIASYYSSPRFAPIQADRRLTPENPLDVHELPESLLQAAGRPRSDSAPVCAAVVQQGGVDATGCRGLTLGVRSPPWRLKGGS